MQHKFQFHQNQISTKSKNTWQQSISYMRLPCPWSARYCTSKGARIREVCPTSPGVRIWTPGLWEVTIKANMAKQQEKSVISQAIPYQPLSSPPTYRLGILRPSARTNRQVVNTIVIWYDNRLNRRGADFYHRLKGKGFCACTFCRRRTMVYCYCPKNVKM